MIACGTTILKAFKAVHAKASPEADLESRDSVKIESKSTKVLEETKLLVQSIAKVLIDDLPKLNAETILPSEGDDTRTLEERLANLSTEICSDLDKTFAEGVRRKHLLGAEGQSEEEKDESIVDYAVKNGDSSIFILMAVHPDTFPDYLEELLDRVLVRLGNASLSTIQGPGRETNT